MADRPSYDEVMAALWADAHPGVAADVERLQQAAARAAGGELAAEEAESARATAHRLAGTLGTLGVEAATAPAVALERAFGAGVPDAAGARAEAERLRAAVEAAAPAG